jgi:type I restriction-modification system DNA methylase subunit
MKTVGNNMSLDDINKVYQALKINIFNSQNEEEIRLSWVRALENIISEPLHAERGKRDLSYNNVVIEFKGPHKFKGKKNNPSFKEAMEHRLLPYILLLSKQENRDINDYIGIAIDSDYICFAQVKNNIIYPQELLPFTIISFNMVAEALKKNFRRSISTENLIEDFGHNSMNGKNLMQALANSLVSVRSENNNHKINMLFEEWKALYGQVADMSKEQINNIKNGLNIKIKKNTKEALPMSLFVIHTYNSLLIKFLAAEIISAYNLTSGKIFSQNLAIISDNTDLANQILVLIERSNFFEANGINSFVEEAIFSWYLDSDQNFLDNIIDGIRDMLIKMSFYRTDKMDHTRDVLKDFYQDLVPDALRKSLGEFYTPDWLVSFSLNKLSNIDYLDNRFLDPTCGSGSFLLEVIRRKKEIGKRNSLDSKKLLENIISTVWGFDLNPLAVQLARTNFLIAISDLLYENYGTQIEMPVLLADAIYSPAQIPGTLDKTVEYRIGSQEADLKIILPSELAFNRPLLNKIFRLMEENVNFDNDYEKCSLSLVEHELLSKNEIIKWENELSFTYNQVLSLHKKNRNGIWFRIVLNFFWSVTAGKFDYIVGNPPWVRWSRLPEQYRERAKPTCEQYDIFSSTPHHGGNELDISGMITYTTSDKWLKEEGKMIFLLTQTHFQSPSSEGFRRFSINKHINLVPSSIDDFKELKLFSGAVNRTAVCCFTKTQNKIKYPIDYYVWNSRNKYTKNIDPKTDLQSVLSKIECSLNEANPIDKLDSPWAILPPGRFELLSKLTGKSEYYQGRKGITTDLNAIYFVTISNTNKDENLVQISTRPESGKIDIGYSLKYWIEPDLLYPLIKGASDFSPCYFKPKQELFVIVPNNGITREKYDIAEAYVNSHNPYLKKYFTSYKSYLNDRSTYLKRMYKAPFYCIYNVGRYTFSKYKVIWAEQSKKFRAAVAKSGQVPLAGTKCYIPDHKIFFIDFELPDPAYFLCGLLNSSLVKEYVESHNISIQVGDIFKHMSLPEYDPKNKHHNVLVQIVKNAHDEDDEFKRINILKCISDKANNLLK